MWTLIIWSALCTAVNNDCLTGDYLVMEKTYTHIKLCTDAGEFWKAPKPLTNRYYCSWTEDFKKHKL